MRLQIQKKKVPTKRAEMLSKCLERLPQCKASSSMCLKKNDIWLVRVWIEAEADKQMDLLCLECSLGELDGLRYRDAAFMFEPAWRIIRPFGEWTKYRVIGTQRHTCSYTQSISRYLCLSFPLSLFFPAYLSLLPPLKLTFILLATMVGLSLCVLAFQVYWVSWLLPSLWCQPNVMPHSQKKKDSQLACWRIWPRACVLAHNACVWTGTSVRASHPSRREWANKSYPLPPLFPISISSFLPINSPSTTVLLLWCSARRAVVEEVWQ